MGGFVFTGPNYTFSSTPLRINCNCRGYKGKISLEQEKELLEIENNELPKHFIKFLDDNKYHYNTTQYISSLHSENISCAEYIVEGNIRKLSIEEMKKFDERIKCKCVPSGQCHSWSLTGCPHRHYWDGNIYRCQLSDEGVFV